MGILEELRKTLRSPTDPQERKACKFDERFKDTKGNFLERNSFYLIREGIRSVVGFYYYSFNYRVYGFGLNEVDGGGFLATLDLAKNAEIIKVRLEAE